MDLWIRSQDRKCLIKTDILEYELDANNKAIIKGSTDMDGWYHTLGKYKNKTRALEVLDEIQIHIEKQGQTVVITNEKGIADGLKYYGKTYEMPKE